MRDWMGRNYTFDIDDPRKPIRTFRQRKPCHFIFEIESYAGLLNTLTAANKLFFETPVFDVGSEKWTMIIYPNGNVPRGGSSNISLYLKRQQSNVTRGRAIYVAMKFFILDQIGNQYLVIEDLGETQIDARLTQWGIAQALQHNDFIYPKNGFLVEDRCVFGAEVFVTSDEPRYSRLTLATSVSNRIFNMTINYGANLPDPMESPIFSTTLDGEVYTWKLQFYRGGFMSTSDANSSLFLVLADQSMVSNGKSMLVHFELSLLNKNRGGHDNKSTLMDWYTDGRGKDRLGFPDFMVRAALHSTANDYTSQGNIEVRVQFHSFFILNDV